MPFHWLDHEEAEGDQGELLEGNQGNGRTERESMTIIASVSG